MKNEEERPYLAMDILGILSERKSHALPIAHTESARSVQRAVQWLERRGLVKYLGEDFWSITEAGETFFLGQRKGES